MSHLLDVSLLLACGWRSHQQHSAACAWLDHQRHFATCPITQLGFLRVSIGPGYGARFEDAMTALDVIIARKGAIFIPDSLPAEKLARINSHGEVTDAYLVALAKAHKFKLATLDDALCAKPWASATAENPFRAS